jgi:hypothetical protein
MFFWVSLMVIVHTNKWLTQSLLPVS